MAAPGADVWNGGDGRNDGGICGKAGAGGGVAIGLTVWMGLRNLGFTLWLVGLGLVLGVGVVGGGRLTEWLEERRAGRRSEVLSRLREGIPDCDCHICTM